MNRNDKILQLRHIMRESGISAVIIPSTDSHGSEYVHPHWKIRAWFTEFNGSAGTLVVTLNKAGLWTDFRYYIEATEVLKGCEIVLYKDGIPETPTITDFLIAELNKNDIVGIDGTLFSTFTFNEYNQILKKKNITINREFDPTNHIWKDRPTKPMSKAYNFPTKYCGEDRDSKILKIKTILKEKCIDTYIISSLSDIAWLLNIRGGDIAYSPLLLCYLIITNNKLILFIDKLKLNIELEDELSKSNIEINDYDSIADYIIRLKTNSTVYYMPESLNCFLSGLIPTTSIVKTGPNFTIDLKSIKNKAEINNLRLTMELDGAALVKFYIKFFNLMKNENVSEFSLEKILRVCRLSMDGCIDESFNPIIGFQSNGALCHYSASENNSKTIENKGLLLIDSGGQYLTGTTDITRTISLGNPTVEEILHYTLVLKGHIKLSMAKFPEGTTGAQLDILAREPLWNHGLNYGHGTGHGVGFFLGVHEGPQNISPKGFKCAIKEGMITSNEPGVYIEGKHGIRIENLVLAKYSMNGLYQKFLEFETLTLFPFDLDLIDTNLLNIDEVTWLNNYHAEVRQRVSKHLNNYDEINWLNGKTREI